MLLLLYSVRRGHVCTYKYGAPSFNVTLAQLSPKSVSHMISERGTTARRGLKGTQQHFLIWPRHVPQTGLKRDSGAL
jgi:hypothetical protein